MSTFDPKLAHKAICALVNMYADVLTDQENALNEAADAVQNARGEVERGKRTLDDRLAEGNAYTKKILDECEKLRQENWRLRDQNIRNVLVVEHRVVQRVFDEIRASGEALTEIEKRMLAATGPAGPDDAEHGMHCPTGATGSAGSMGPTASIFTPSFTESVREYIKDPKS